MSFPGDSVEITETVANVQTQTQTQGTTKTTTVKIPVNTDAPQLCLHPEIYDIEYADIEDARAYVKLLLDNWGSINIARYNLCCERCGPACPTAVQPGGPRNQPRIFEPGRIGAGGVSGGRPEFLDGGDLASQLPQLGLTPEQIAAVAKENPGLLGPGPTRNANVNFVGGKMGIGNPNRLVILADSQGHRALRTMLMEYDRKPATIEIHVTVCEVDEVAARALGIRGPTSTQLQYHEQSLFGNYNAESVGQLVRTNGVALALTLDHMIRQQHARRLTDTSVTTSDNVPAKLFVGDLVPVAIPLEKNLLVSGTIVTTSAAKVSWYPVGIMLLFQPRLGRGGEDITLALQPSITKFVPSAKSGIPEYVDVGDNVKAPIIQTQELGTLSNIAANEPFVIGGLITQQDKVVIDKIPLLSSLPLVGKLFRSKSTTRDDKEICIIVTTKVLACEHEAASNPPCSCDCHASEFR